MYSFSSVTIGGVSGHASIGGECVRGGDVKVHRKGGEG